MAVQLVSITSSAPKAVYDVRAYASVTIYPTSAGTATVYVSTSPSNYCKADVAANNFSTGTAKWTAWSSGAVVAATSEVALGNLTAVAVLPASGTWTLEVAQ